MHHLKIIICMFILTQIILAQNKPFPQQIDFPGCIKPSNVTQSSMDSTIADYYKKWKSRYLKKSEGGKIGNGYYIYMKGTGGSGSEVTTSEAHGYGMIIFALMAGYDDSAKIYFDGMVNLFDLHRSTINDNLMSWIIDTVNGNSDAATDGDMDIAYSLLLADNQWGSQGKINYRSKSLTMINSGIKGSDVRTGYSKRTTLGDWDSNPYNTRSSDWMADHMRAYHDFTSDTFWLEATDTIYSIITQISSTYSKTTGLMPDFIVGKNAAPAEPDFLEAETDGDYSWNACRFPWRIAVDYAHYGTGQAKQSLNKILNWLKGTTDDDPKNIVAGYKLDGSKAVRYSDVAFTAPFIAACIVDATYQEYLNNGWNVIQTAQGDYYGDSIALLCLLLISGNWWKPSFSSSYVHENRINKKESFKCSSELKNQSLKVTYDLPVRGSVKVSLFDCSGRVCKEVEQINRIGLQSVSLDVNSLNSGIYLLKIHSSTGTESKVFRYVHK